MDQLSNEISSTLHVAQEKDTDKMALVAKMMTMKDNLMKQITQALIYKKIVLWMDLDIWRSDTYIRNTVIA
jgi:hypothetical protein